MEWIPLRWLGLGLALRCRRTRESIISSWVNLAMSSSLRCWYLSRFTATCVPSAPSSGVRVAVHESEMLCFVREPVSAHALANEGENGGAMARWPNGLGVRLCSS